MVVRKHTQYTMSRTRQKAASDFSKRIAPDFTLMPQQGDDFGARMAMFFTNSLIVGIIGLC